MMRVLFQVSFFVFVWSLPLATVALDYISSETFSEPHQPLTPGKTQIPPKHFYKQMSQGQLQANPFNQASNPTEITAIEEVYGNQSEETIVIKNIRLKKQDNIKVTGGDPMRPKIGAMLGIDAGKQSKTIIIENVQLQHQGIIESPDMAALIGIRSCVPSEIIINNVEIINDKGNLRAYTGASQNANAALIGIDQCGQQGNNVTIRNVHIKSHGGTFDAQ